ncbi:hypothetical protein [Candidatus Palauibacter sp.]|uniref:hypothetical protein n=1 Tax=Candidatus Palauibacter sp. TaxID=3101350 RepID=UPI003AF27315
MTRDTLFDWLRRSHTVCDLERPDSPIQDTIGRGVIGNVRKVEARKGAIAERLIRQFEEDHPEAVVNGAYHRAAFHAWLQQRDSQK